jgi:hypothetical protein
VSKEFNPDYLIPPREDARFPILKARADSHWYEFRPKIYRALKKAGKLDHSLDLAVESAILVLHQCERAGLSPDQAEELAMQEILLPPL